MRAFAVGARTTSTIAATAAIQAACACRSPRRRGMTSSLTNRWASMRGSRLPAVRLVEPFPTSGRGPRARIDADQVGGERLEPGVSLVAHAGEPDGGRPVRQVAGPAAADRAAVDDVDVRLSRERRLVGVADEEDERFLRRA